jgi:sugar-specific transcriptional regulator TrmB
MQTAQEKGKLAYATDDGPFGGVDQPSGGVDRPLSQAKYADIASKLEDLTSSVESSLAEMGLTNNEAKIYVLLAKKGAKKASEVAKLLNFPRPQAYYLLRSLYKKGIVSRTMHNPARFVAISFGDALNTLLDMQKEKLVKAERDSQTLLGVWSSIASHEVTYQEIEEEKLQTLEGSGVVYRRIRDMVSAAEREVIIMADQRELVRLHHNEITDHFKALSSNDVDVKVLTFSEPRYEAVKEIKNCELTIIPDSNANVQCIMVDRKYMVFVRDSARGFGPSAIWTDCSSIIQCFLCMFEGLWKRA